MCSVTCKGFLWSLADPRRKHVRNGNRLRWFPVRVWFQIPRTFKVAPASKQTSIWLWLPWPTPHWQVRTRANAVRGPLHRSLLALAAEFDGMISSRGVCVYVCLSVCWGGHIVTPLLASAREAALWLQLQHTAVSVKADRGVKPAAPRSRVRRCCAETPPTTAGRRQLPQWEESTNVVLSVSWSAERAKKVVKVVSQ